MTSAVEIEKEDFLRIFLIIWLIGAIIYFILQFFLPEFVASASVWPLSVWQKEVALWNAGLIFGIIYALYLNKPEISKYFTSVLMVFSAIIGSYNLYTLIVYETFALINFFWILGNYFEVGFGIYVLYLNNDESY